ncbi:DHHA1 domain-containing protein [Candidatus Parvarchaeota archaeon]|nr:DHHA1 domain-containing protein [Candidatus Parvarchaeota archaeon]
MDEAKKEESIKSVRDFVSKNNDFTVFYHLDTDGIVSATLLTAALKKINKGVYYYRPTNYEDYKNLDMQEYSKNIIVCDMQIREDQLPLFKDKNLCIIDHHQAINADLLAYANPKIWGDNTYTPCSLLVYRIFEQEINELDWASAIGLVGDSGGKENSDFVKKTAEKYGIKIGKDDFMYDNDFGKAAEMIGSMTTLYNREGADEALGILISSKSIADVLSNQKLVFADKKVREELEKLKKDFSENVQKHGKIYFYELDQKKKRYSSTLVTELSFDKEYYGNVLVFMTKINARTMRLNLRANGVEIKLPVMLNNIFKKMKGEGGGHDKASGGSIDYKDKEKFKELFLEEASDIK